jgi:predicted ATPase
MVIVDREPELAQLNAALESAKGYAPSLVLIVGDSGTGKSFLADNFLRQAETTHPDLVAACGSGQPLAGRATSLQPFREILEYLAGFSDSKSSVIRSTTDNPTVRGVRKKVLSGLLTDPNDALSAILPRPSPDQITKYQIDQDNVKEWLRRVSQGSKGERVDNLFVIRNSIANLFRLADCILAIVLDDIQWVDTASLQLFFMLQRELEGQRLLLLATARTDDEMGVPLPGDFTIDQLRTSILRDQRNVLIDLNSVRRTRGRNFCSELLRVKGFEPSEENVVQFLQLTGANALFARDVLESLVEPAESTNGHIVDSGLRLSNIDWRHLPQNHQDTLQRRFEQLTRKAAGILEIAAVEGQEFTPEVIAQIKGADLLEVLDVLEVELINEHRLVEDITITPERDFILEPHKLSRFRFSHGYYQQFIYDVRLQPARRKELHRRVGLALEGLWAPQTDLVAAGLGKHFEAAGERNRAVLYYAKAARRNLDLADFEAAALCANDGLRMARFPEAEDLPAELDELYTVGTSAARARGDFNFAASLAREGLSSLTAASTSVTVRLKSELARSLYNLDTGFDEAERLLGEAIEIATALGDTRTRADLFRQRGILFQRQARFLEALQQYLEALRIAHDNEADLVCADIINSVGVAFGLCGFFAFAVSCHEKALTLAHKLGAASRNTLFLNDCAAPMRRIGRLDQAHEMTQQSVRLAEDQGKPGALARAKYEQAQIARVNSEWDRYASLLHSVLRQASNLGSQSPHLRKALGELVLLSILEPSIRIVPTPGEAPFGPAGITGTTEMHSVEFITGVCALKDQSRGRALSCFSQLHVSVQGAANGYCWAWPFLKILASLGEAACRSGDDAMNLKVRAHEETLAAHRQFGLQSVWQDVQFYGNVLSSLTGETWPPKDIPDIEGATDPPFEVAQLLEQFREELDRF